MICELILASIRVLGPCSPINQPFTLCGNETGPPVGTSYLLGASIHLLLSIHTLSWYFLINLLLSSCDDWASLLHFQRAAWCQWRMAAEHRTGRTRNAHMSPWPVSVLALSCISLATTTICTWTQMVIHQMEVFSQQHLSSGAEDGYSGKLWCDLWGGPTFPCCGR